MNKFRFYISSSIIAALSILLGMFIAIIDISQKSPNEFATCHRPDSVQLKFCDSVPKDATTS